MPSRIHDSDSSVCTRWPYVPYFPHQFWIIATTIALEKAAHHDSGKFVILCLIWECGWKPMQIKISGSCEHGKYREQELEGFLAELFSTPSTIWIVFLPTRSFPNSLIPVTAFDNGRQEKQYLAQPFCSNQISFCLFKYAIGYESNFKSATRPKRLTREKLLSPIESFLH